MPKADLRFEWESEEKQSEYVALAPHTRSDLVGYTGLPPYISFRSVIGGGGDKSLFTIVNPFFSSSHSKKRSFSRTRN